MEFLKIFWSFFSQVPWSSMKFYGVLRRSFIWVEKLFFFSIFFQWFIWKDVFFVGISMDSAGQPNGRPCHRLLLLQARPGPDRQSRPHSSAYSALRRRHFPAAGQMECALQGAGPYDHGHVFGWNCFHCCRRSPTWVRRKLKPSVWSWKKSLWSWPWSRKEWFLVLTMVEKRTFFGLDHGREKNGFWSWPWSRKKWFLVLTMVQKRTFFGLDHGREKNVFWSEMA